MTIGDDEFAMRRERLTVSAINRLGTRIRMSDVLSPGDLNLLQRLREEHFDLLDSVQADIQSRLPAVDQTSRLKTVQTIVDKVRRGTSLSRMQDIAGVRIVQQMNRVQQDNLVAQVAEAVGECKIVDRRTRPQFGYRAVHLLVRRDERWVEIQVRTQMQDQWAQITESLGDAWGRQIRYGQLPLEPDRRVLASDISRRDLWAMVQTVADSIEALELSIVRMQSEPDDELGQDIVELREQLSRILEGIAKALEDTDRL
ncbi:MAG: RelA/SpoT domain-containing protein [Candidatus Limnocylindrales bacterium]|jgi:ppGpp synthetase/RelA/SpoT-type nucleotidyltranferase